MLVVAVLHNSQAELFDSLTGRYDIGYGLLIFATWAASFGVGIFSAGTILIWAFSKLERGK